MLSYPYWIHKAAVIFFKFSISDARPPQITYENNKPQPPRINATVEDIGQEVVYAIYVSF